MGKIAFLLLGVGSCTAIVQPARGLSRRELSRAATIGAAAFALPPPSFAGPSSDLKTDRVVAMNKYLARVNDGRAYWVNELPRAISSSDWKTVDASISVGIDPKDRKGKRKAYGPILGMVGPLELWASSFSRGAQRSPETTEMLAAVEDFKGAISLLEVATAGKVNDGGLFGFFGGMKEPSAAEREKNARLGLSQGSKALNDYFKVLNGFLKVMGEPLIGSV
jgi:hypothetical protein